MDGKPVEASPRVALKQQIARAENLGFRMKTGVECEYFLVSADGSSISDPNDTQEKPCYDQSALMRQYDVISEICDSMIELGRRISSRGRGWDRSRSRRYCHCRRG